LTLFERDVESPGAALPAGLTDRLIIGPDTARARFRELILSARRSIRLVDHRVTDPDMLELLRSREAQGLKVKVYGQGALQGLRSHGKVMLIDDGKAVLGSMSLSPPSLGARREVAVITEDPGCVEQVRQCLKKGRASALPEKAEEAPGKDEEEEEEEEENREDS
jgi:phosphatidylserine/phosphatidylglycerophosphate/cardiolipin synthase-like enzyme